MKQATHARRQDQKSMGYLRNNSILLRGTETPSDHDCRNKKEKKHNLTTFRDEHFVICMCCTPQRETRRLRIHRNAAIVMSEPENIPHSLMLD